MRLITWNCQGAFRKKADFILALQPDILVIQECEHPDKLKFSAETLKPDSVYWYSDGGKKGIGIFSYSNYKFELLPEFNPEFRYVLPIQVTGNGQTFTLLAVWAMDNKEKREARYIGQVWLAINHYKDLLGSSTILIGDFNSNKIWDYKDRVGSHSDVVRYLASRDIHSVYHKHFNMEQGKEEHPTLYLYRNLEKPYHIDYCFASADLLEKVKQVEIGSYENWFMHSDHSPVCVLFEM
ncbi:MAG TPA: endonuclease/exonuclease/phosphatase family protein [Bacteroidia bacterium]|nr:endonuclease/exonuclease/phosphatase family protein [Bacteroidota bacterium]MBK8584336.1 endonuclease/exonuclease/phosphatase family protein [Bacteroidota bacterium]HQV98810.1 endonuclease/exonuclease/phosphatase family protein [Bacteroidia bacterium]HQW22004.1 endonuclease/exonuclease/phosphatase family protein [Bacteroidia bacterium]